MREVRSDAGCQKRVVFVHQSWKNPEVANSEQEDDNFDDDFDDDFDDNFDDDFDDDYFDDDYS